MFEREIECLSHANMYNPSIFIIHMRVKIRRHKMNIYNEKTIFRARTKSLGPLNEFYPATY